MDRETNRKRRSERGREIDRVRLRNRQTERKRDRQRYKV